eukprot:TRINITY_DN1763_c0_g1_i1.p2 TRINITY_DN1763_c0_g1~~TRINITY_DN1763_c0_g1_i1.p2  ORF type:complete len:327 (-),score=81.20 TRINITY_DN1763_c0_g1_i1:65-1045(-)
MEHEPPPLESEIEKLRLELQNEQQKRIAAEQQLLVQADSQQRLNKQIGKITTDLNEVKVQKISLETELLKLKKEKEKWEFHAKNDAGYNDELMKDWIKERDEKQKLEKLLSEQKVRIQNLVTEITLLRSKELFKEKPQLGESEEVILIEDDEEEELEKKKLLKDFDTLYSELEKHKESLARIKDENASYESELKDERRKNQDLKNETERLNKEMKEITANLHEKTVKLELIEKERTQLKADIGFYRTEAMKAKRENEKKAKTKPEEPTVVVDAKKAKEGNLRKENVALENALSSTKTMKTKRKKLETGGEVFDNDLSKYLFVQYNF